MLLWRIYELDTTAEAWIKPGMQSLRSSTGRLVKAEYGAILTVRPIGSQAQDGGQDFLFVLAEDLNNRSRRPSTLAQVQ